MLRELSGLGICTVAIFGCAIAAAQSSTAPGQECSLSESFREDGWEIPWRHNAKLGPRMSLVINGNHTDIWVARIKPTKEPVTLLLPFCSSKGGGQLDLPARLVRTEEILQYDVKERVFAYGVRAAWLARSTSGQIIDIASASELLFIDDRGDGVFRIMKYRPFPFQLSRPEWVNALP